MLIDQVWASIQKEELVRADRRQGHCRQVWTYWNRQLNVPTIPLMQAFLVVAEVSAVVGKLLVYGHDGPMGMDVRILNSTDWILEILKLCKAWFCRRASDVTQFVPTTTLS